MTFSESAPAHVDVLIAGAGPSGIGAACHLQTEAPGTSYTILEARGTCGLVRYPVCGPAPTRAAVAATQGLS